jgi:hypothetical protein
VAEAQGHHQQAMTYLRSARGKLLGLQSSNSANADRWRRAGGG